MKKAEIEHYGYKSQKISSSLDAYGIFKNIFPSIDYVEYFFAMFLNRRNAIIGFYMVSKGGYSGTLVDPKVIFREALLCKASSIVLAHNHPSGETSVSNADKLLTKKLCEVGKLLELHVLDHIIVCEDTFLSMADEGLI